MRARLLPLLLLPVVCLQAEDFVTLDGQEYKDVSNVKATADGVSFMNDTGW